MDIQLEDISFLFAIALMHGYQLAGNARSVGDARRKFKINPPEMNGPPEFLRTVRVQQNDLEFALIFEILLWTSGICLHQVPAAILGLYYLYGRYSYKVGYIEAVENRRPGFGKSVMAIRLLLLLSAVGLVFVWVRQFGGVDLGLMVKKQVRQTTGIKLEL